MTCPRWQFDSVTCLIYASPYTHISCSGYPVHLKINKNFVLDIQNILTQYQMLTFFDFQNICFSIYTHFTNRFFRLFVIFKKIFNRKKRLFFDQYQKFNFLDSQNICAPLIDTFRVPYIRNILKLAKILFRIYGTFLTNIKC